MRPFSRRAGLLASLAAGLATIVAAADEPGTTPAVGAFSLVEGRTKVLACKAEGTRVAKGAVVCELDPSAAKGRLEVQESLVAAAKASLAAAQVSREAAEIQVVEYLEGTYKQELETALGAIALAESNLKRAEDQLAWSDRMLQKGYIPLGENIVAKLTLQREKFVLEQAQTRKLVLERFTKGRTTKDLSSRVEAARVVERTNQAALAREVVALRRARAQLEACAVVAPAEGRVRLAPGVEPGALVSEGQLLFRVAAGSDAAPAPRPGTN